MRYLFIVLIFFLASCSHRSDSERPFASNSAPELIIQPVVDLAYSNLSKQTASYLSRSIADRLTSTSLIPFTFSHKKLREVQEEGGRFYVCLQLIETDQRGDYPTEISLSVHVKIYDLRGNKPQVLLQEVVNRTTLLKGPVTHVSRLGWNEKPFRVSPLGLTLAKMAREISTRIEDYILLTTNK